MTRRTGAGLVVTRTAWTMSAWDTSPGTTPSTRAGAAGDELAEGGFGQPQEGAHDAQNRPHGDRRLRHRAGRFAGYGAVAQGAGRADGGRRGRAGGVDICSRLPLVVSSTGAGGWAGGASRPRGGADRGRSSMAPVAIGSIIGSHEQSCKSARASPRSAVFPVGADSPGDVRAAPWADRAR